MSKKIILLGYMGCGKSTIGAHIATTLSLPFQDLDVFIAEQEGKSIPEIFQEKGEIYFRRQEQEHLKRLLALPYPMVVALGGGTPCYGKAMELVREATPYSFYLQLPAKELVAINQTGSIPWDAFWLAITNAWHWVPFFALILWANFYFFEKRKAWRIFGYAIGTLLFTVLITNTTKELVARLRPLHTPELIPQLRILLTERGYSFFSGHTSNSFALTTFLYLVFRKRMKVAFWLFLWPIPYAYSRLYLGVHFPTDILVGLLVGITTAHIGYWLYRKNEQRLISKDSPQYTPQPLQK